MRMNLWKKITTTKNPLMDTSASARSQEGILLHNFNLIADQFEKINLNADTRIPLPPSLRCPDLVMTRHENYTGDLDSKKPSDWITGGNNGQNMKFDLSKTRMDNR